MSARQACRWREFANRADLQAAVVAAIIAAAGRAIAAHGAFRLVLAGGTTPRAIYQALRLTGSDWPAWQVYFGDERCLPADDPARNSSMAGAAWLDHVAIPPAQIHAIPAELGAQAGAAAYAQALAGLGDFDLVLLGLGEDGHTASLFPGHPWETAASLPAAIPVLAAPKPPAQRVSLSPARLSAATQVLFVVDGAGKRAALQAWRAGAPIPASRIAPPNGVDVHFHLSPDP